MRLAFEKPAILRGILISADIGGGIALAEIAAGVNAEEYGTSPAAEWLIHTSYSADPYAFVHGSIDENVQFSGAGIRIDSEDHLMVGAFLQNTTDDPNSVSPEVVVYFEWSARQVRRR